FTIGEGELMAHDVPLGCAPDEYDDLISGTCSHLPWYALYSSPPGGTIHESWWDRTITLKT
ncbi:hypothetical protein ACSLNU_09435, partial [Klebsiella variicola]